MWSGIFAVAKTNWRCLFKTSWSELSSPPIFFAPKFFQQNTCKMATSVSSPKVFIRNIPDRAKALILAECNAVVWDKDEPPPKKELLKMVEGVDGILCLITDKIDGEILQHAGPNLQVVSTMSVGYDHIDVTECAKRNIKVGFTPGILTRATAELTVALLLATSRRLKEGIKAVENGEWGTWKPLWMCGPGLDGSTVGIVGMGRIGYTVAECLKPFGVSKLLYSGNTKKPEAESNLGAELVPFDKLLAESDFVIACCAFTPQTKEMFNSDAFKKMKKTAVFVNSSRGGTVNQEDLYAALKSGEIGAAGLDVTTPEPLPTDSPLLTLDNCVVLPHIGSATYDSREAMAMMAAQNLIAGVKGENMPNQLHL